MPSTSWGTTAEDERSLSRGNGEQRKGSQWCSKLRSEGEHCRPEGRGVGGLRRAGGLKLSLCNLLMFGGVTLSSPLLPCPGIHAARTPRRHQSTVTRDPISSRARSRLTEVSRAERVWRHHASKTSIPAPCWDSTDQLQPRAANQRQVIQNK